MAEVIGPPTFDGRRWMLGGAVAGVIGFIALAFGLASDPERALLSYLWAFVFVFTISVGGLILLMIGYAANASWMAVVRRVNELTSLALPALAVLFVPIALGLAWLYPWHTPPPHLDAEAREVIHHREPYLNPTFFILRAVVFFAILIIASSLLRRWSARRDAGAPPPAADAPEELLGRERGFASAMLPAVGLAFTFAILDWVMSLQPIWFSSMFPVNMFAGGFVAAIALVTILAERTCTTGRSAGALTPNHFYALGRMLFAFTVFWAYTAFFQAMLMRIANKPIEVEFYLRRLEDGWLPFWYVLILGHFALPFFLLLPKGPKFRPGLMSAMGVWIVLMHAVDTYWNVIPSHASDAVVLHVLDVAALAAVVGPCLAVAAWRQHGLALVGIHDPFFRKGAAYRSPL